MIDLRGKLPARAKPLLRAVEEIKYIVIHHSGVDYDSSAYEINDYHLNTLLWDIGCGYHYIVRWGGNIEWVGDLTEIRYNVASRNREVVGICLPGNWGLRTPPKVALEAIRGLTSGLWDKLGRQIPVVGHKDIALPGNETECPGSTWEQWKDALTMDVAAAKWNTEEAVRQLEAIRNGGQTEGLENVIRRLLDNVLENLKT